MVQVAKRNYNGSIKYCRMHVLLRDVAIQKAKDNNFLMVFPYVDSPMSSDKARRIAVHYLNDGQLIKVTYPNIRSLLPSSGGANPNISRFRLLRVFNNLLDNLNPMNTRENTIKDFKELTQLRYFWFLSMLSDSYNFSRYLEKFIRHNKCLQTIDLSSFTRDVPNCLWDIKTLRHVILPFYSRQGPPSSADLRNLQTLRGVCVQNSWNKRSPYLPKLCELNVSIIENGEHRWEAVANLLRNLEHLIHLEIISDVKINISDMNTFPCYKNIQVLFLSGGFFLGSQALNVGLFPVHLINLKLSNTNLGKDPLPIIGKLKNLKKLKLEDNVYGVTKMTCLAGDFLHLKGFTIKGPLNVEEFNIENGSLPKLEKLRVNFCEKMFEGVHHVTTLQKFTWDGNLVKLGR